MILFGVVFYKKAITPLKGSYTPIKPIPNTTKVLLRAVPATAGGARAGELLRLRAPGAYLRV